MNTTILILSIFLCIFLLISILFLVLLLTSSAFSAMVDPSVGSYRIGDAFYHKEFNNSALEDAYRQFPNSLVAKSNADVTELVKILKEKYYLDTPEIVVHLRLGDLTPQCKNRPGGVRKININAPALEMAKKIKNLLPNHEALNSKLVFITGNHRNVCVAEMEKYIRDVKLQFPQALVVNNGSSFVEADNDFVRMIAADTFVQASGGYSKLVAQIRSTLGKKTVVI